MKSRIVSYSLSALRRLPRDARGAVSILSAFTLPVVIGFIALAAEYGAGLATQTQNQLIADLAGHQAAVYYAANSSSLGSSAALTGATSVAQNIAALNGLAAANVAVSLVTSPANASQQAIKVQVAGSRSLYVAQIVGGSTTMNVAALSTTQFSAQAACFISLSASVNFTLNGGTTFTSANCGVAANASFSVPCGTSMTVKSVTYGATAPSQPCSGISASSLAQVTVTDPLAANAGVTAARARQTTVAALSSPAAPTASGGTALNFDWTLLALVQAPSMGCTATLFLTTWTFTCPAGTHTISSMSIGGGMSVNFNTSGSASNTYNFVSTVNNDGTAVTFGPGNYNFAGGLIAGFGSTTTFNSGGTFKFGSTGSSCNGGGTYSICDLSALAFNGAGSFILSNGVYVGGGATLSMGSGSNNSFQFGASSDGNAIWTGGGANASFADATGGSSVFQANGNINILVGGACVSIGAAAQHDINGYFNTTGGTTLGAGVYTINGYFAAGADYGGSVTCNSVLTGVLGNGVTLSVNAAMTTDANCGNYAFCVGNGYTPFALSAPTSGTTANLLVVGPASGGPAGALFTGGASATTLSGTVYMPTGAFTTSGGAIIANASSQCLQVVAASIAFNYNVANGASCVSTLGGSTTVATVQ